MISKNGIVSVYGFLLGLSILFVWLLLQHGVVLTTYVDSHGLNLLHLFVVYAAITNVLVRLVNRGTTYKVSAVIAVWTTTNDTRVYISYIATCLLTLFRYAPRPCSWAWPWLQGCWSRSKHRPRGSHLDGNKRR